MCPTWSKTIKWSLSACVIWAEAKGKMHEKVMELLAAPTIDKAAIEAVRAEQVANMTAKSKLMTDAMIEAADILTPEQRATLAEEMKKHRRHD